MPILVKTIESPLAQLKESILQQVCRRPFLFCSRLATLFLGLFLLWDALRSRDREEHIQPRALVERLDRLRHLIDWIFFYLRATAHTEGLPDSRKQQPQIIVNFRGSCNRRPRIARAVLLLDSDCRSDAVDEIYVGLFNPLQKLPRIC